jgi:hypothetical protein
MCGSSEFKIDNNVYWLGMGYFGGTMDVLPDGGFIGSFGISSKSSFARKKRLREHLASLGTDKLVDLIIGLVENGEED